ncbi:hypothetical protein GGX14DRAFT_461399 [Mycena pura]|uniref:HMG box domain-containing protein n=1 Tax=Mycena pura TaxID=153505 RepID=A0AAD6YB60_9AGAR|nr:hypothetical protein GGX14DRAFT_461399 [Mycena pura]
MCLLGEVHAVSENRQSSTPRGATSAMPAATSAWGSFSVLNIDAPPTIIINNYFSGSGNPYGETTARAFFGSAPARDWHPPPASSVFTHTQTAPISPHWPPSSALADDLTDLQNSASKPGSNSSQPKRGDADYVRRPPNAFMLFRSWYCANKAGGKKERQVDLNQTVSQLWKALSPEERKAWGDRADKKKEEHRAQYPNYKYRPQRHSAKNHVSSDTLASSFSSSTVIPASASTSPLIRPSQIADDALASLQVCDLFSCSRHADTAVASARGVPTAAPVVTGGLLRPTSSTALSAYPASSVTLPAHPSFSFSPASFLDTPTASCSELLVTGRDAFGWAAVSPSATKSSDSLRVIVSPAQSCMSPTGRTISAASRTAGSGRSSPAAPRDAPSSLISQGEVPLLHPVPVTPAPSSPWCPCTPPPSCPPTPLHIPLLHRAPSVWVSQLECSPASPPSHGETCSTARRLHRRRPAPYATSEARASLGRAGVWRSSLRSQQRRWTIATRWTLEWANRKWGGTGRQRRAVATDMGADTGCDEVPMVADAGTQAPFGRLIVSATDRRPCASTF